MIGRSVMVCRGRGVSIRGLNRSIVVYKRVRGLYNGL